MHTLQQPPVELAHVGVIPPNESGYPYYQMAGKLGGRCGVELYHVLVWYQRHAATEASLKLIAYYFQQQVDKRLTVDPWICCGVKLHVIVQVAWVASSQQFVVNTLGGRQAAVLAPKLAYRSSYVATLAIVVFLARKGVSLGGSFSIVRFSCKRVFGQGLFRDLGSGTRGRRTLRLLGSSS